MKNKNQILLSAVRTISREAKAVMSLVNNIDDDFTYAVELIYKSEGKVIVTGVGKSANISQKLVATLNSTGTESVFMHAADAIHGDLGIIKPGDVIICLSKSGNTPEIKTLLPLIKRLGNKIIAIVSDQGSYLAENSDYVLKATVQKEACPNNLAPTSSTTAQLVLGDALAICLLECRGFTSDDFALIHPGGTLGKKLYMKVRDLCFHNVLPCSKPKDSLKQVIIEISSKLVGATVITTEENNILGIITDGDLRRMLEENDSINGLKAEDIMTQNPKTIEKDAMALVAYNLMENHKITQIPVTENGKYAGIIHLHDILREGIV